MTNNLPKFFKTLAIVLFLSAASTNGQAQSITLLAPNGGEEWLVDSYEEISWTVRVWEASWNLISHLMAD